MQSSPYLYMLFVARAAVIYVGVLCFIVLIKRFGVVFATGGARGLRAAGARKLMARRAQSPQCARC